MKKIIAISLFILWRGSTAFAESPAGMCQVPPAPEQIRCDVTSGTFCVETPPGSIVGQEFILTGTVGQSSSGSAIGITVQHEYTHRFGTVPTNHPSHDCTVSPTLEEPFCLSSDGHFSARLPLFDVGPHTILVTATGGEGMATQKVVTTSRVTSLTMTKDQVNVESSEAQAMVTVKLLGDCSFCDFIGASTNGVTVTVTNQNQPPQGTARSIACTTSTEQGGSGTFVVGVPLEDGENVLTVTACNAATIDHCPTVGSITLAGHGGSVAFNILTPPPAPAYSATRNTLPFSFEMQGLPKDACVDVVMNRTAPTSLCPDASGVYRQNLSPQVGINIVSVKANDREFLWSFGWGNMVKETLPHGAAVALPARTASDIIAPLISNFLQSDEFEELVQRTTGDGMSSTKNSDREQFAFCQEESSFGSEFTVGVREAPTLGTARLEGIEFENGQCALTINADDVKAKISLKKSNGDELPLTISFRKALIDLVVKLQSDQHGEEQLLLTSSHTDCDYKSHAYCKGFPAPLIPANFMGNAGRLGHFVACDVNEVSPDLREVCESFNTVNAQTGIISEKVLDALNTTLYCSGSTALTSMMKEGFTSKIGPWELPITITLDHGITIDQRGLGLSPTIHIDGSVITDPRSVSLDAGSLFLSGGHQMSAAVSTNLMNAVLSALVEKGALDIDFSENRAKELGIDFVAECDEAGTPGTLCNIRPRVGELLGTALTTYGYFEPQQPLLVEVRGNRALTPRLAAVKIEEIPVVMEDETSSSFEESETTFFDFQVGGLELSFSALDPRGVESPRPIIAFDLSLLLALEVKGPDVDPTDPSRYLITIRPLADRSQLFLTPISETNTTTVPAESLVATLRDKLRLALSGYSSPDKAIQVSLPKEFDLPPLLGLQTFSFAPGGIAFTSNPDREILNLGFDGVIEQLLHQKGTEIRAILPH